MSVARCPTTGSAMKQSEILLVKLLDCFAGARNDGVSFVVPAKAGDPYAVSFRFNDVAVIFFTVSAGIDGSPPPVRNCALGKDDELRGRRRTTAFCAASGTRTLNSVSFVAPRPALQARPSPPPLRPAHLLAPAQDLHRQHRMIEALQVQIVERRPSAHGSTMPKTRWRPRSGRPWLHRTAARRDW